MNIEIKPKESSFWWKNVNIKMIAPLKLSVTSSELSFKCYMMLQIILTSYRTASHQTETLTIFLLLMLPHHDVKLIVDISWNLYLDLSKLMKLHTCTQKINFTWSSLYHKIIYKAFCINHVPATSMTINFVDVVSDKTTKKS